MASDHVDGDPRIWRRARRWLFDADFFQHHTPSRKIGLTMSYENQSLQHLCTFIQDLGQKIGVAQLCINTACVYLRRFYCFVDLKTFQRHLIAATCLFLAAKVEEQPRKLEQVLTFKAKLLGQPELTKKELETQAELLKLTENDLLKRLGFDFSITHPHTYVVKGCSMLNASKAFAQTAYFLATNSLHLTNMCVQYPASTVACVCIFLAAKWARYQIPQSQEGKVWYSYIDKDITEEMIQSISAELMATFEQCPDKLKRNFPTNKMQQDKEEPDRKRRRTEVPSATITSSSQPATGLSDVSGNYSQSAAAASAQPGSRSQPLPGSSGESSSRSHVGEPNRQQQQLSSTYRLGVPQSSKSRHPQAEMSGHPQVKTEPGSLSVTSAASRFTGGPAVPSTCHGSTQPTAVYNATVASSIKTEPGVKGFRPESHLTGTDARDKHQPSHGHPNPPTVERQKKSQKLTLQDYQQRVEQRPPPPVTIKTEPQHQPAPVKEFKVEVKASPVKNIKKEGVISSVPQNVHLKEAKVLVQDLKDSHGQDRVLYANAEASRRRSLSQSQDDEGETWSAARHGRSHQHQHQHQRHHHHSDLQADQRHMLQAHRHHSGKALSNAAGSEGSEKPTPIKLHIKRDAGTLQVRHSSHESSSSKSPSSLKMKICMNPQTAAMHSAEVASSEQRDQGLKLRLPASSGRSLDKHSLDKHSHHHASSAHGQFSNGGHERKHKHGSRSHTQLPGPQSTQYSGHPLAAEKSLHRSASSSQVAPPPHAKPGVALGSSQPSFQNRKAQSRPTLKTQNSGFSFPEHFISPTVPDMIFEPDTPTDVNGSGLDPPQTPTPENMNRVKAQMQQLFAQTKSQQQSAVNYPAPSIHPSMLHLYRPTQPPLPPPLPQNPPPPPPPPPQ